MISACHRLILTMSVIIALAACAIQPPSADLAQGSQAYAQAKSSLPLVESGPDYDRVQRVGRHIAAAAPTAYTRYEFALIDEPVLNAWALPGGKIAIYQGMLDFLDNDAQLAAVLGHEAAHATLRHSAKRQARAQSAQIAAIGIGILGAAVGGESGAQTGAGLATVAAQYGLLLPYGRDNELEADSQGALYMAKAGYDPREAPKVWQKMLAGRDGAPPEFLSTHPADQRRINQLTARMAEFMAAYEAAAVRRY